MTRNRRWLISLPAVGISLLMARVALATPELPIDDLTYLDLYRLQDLGRTPSGALVETRPLTEAQAQSLLLEAGGQPSPILLDPALRGFWARPTQRVTARLALDTDTARPYSVPARYRNLVGSVDLACEHQEGRPCGDGAHGLLELDSSAGFGPWLSAFSRIQVGANSNDGSASARADRLYANLEWGPAELLVGRNVILIGPGRHTQLLWGDHASPLDQLALKIREFRVPSVPVTIGGAYILGRLAAPQRFNNTLVTLSRAYVNIADRLCLGLSNLLELGGEGAPQLGFWQFAEEHVHRTGPAETEGVSNRRVGVDMTLSLPPLRSTFYSEIVFEDSRRQFGSALAYDTDYLLGWATSALGHERSPRRPTCYRTDSRYAAGLTCWKRRNTLQK